MAQCDYGKCSGYVQNLECPKCHVYKASEVREMVASLSRGERWLAFIFGFVFILPWFALLLSGPEPTGAVVGFTCSVCGYAWTPAGDPLEVAFQ